MPVPRVPFAQLFHKSFGLRLDVKKKKKGSNSKAGEGEEHEDNGQVSLKSIQQEQESLLIF